MAPAICSFATSGLIAMESKIGPDVGLTPAPQVEVVFVLDTTGSAWKVGWYIGTGYVSEKVFESNPQDITAISFGTSEFAGAIGNFKLLVD